MDIVWFLIIGAVAGWLAGLIMKKESASLLRNIVVGIVGALIGGWVFPMVGIQFAGLLGAIIMATGGAVILLFLIEKLT
jgi:uncharacterized membrane protein YeaQ/YmgE (transglycosylase-associated protein family)